MQDWIKAQQSDELTVTTLVMTEYMYSVRRTLASLGQAVVGFGGLEIVPCDARYFKIIMRAGCYPHYIRVAHSDEVPNWSGCIIHFKIFQFGTLPAFFSLLTRVEVRSH